MLSLAELKRSVQVLAPLLTGARLQRVIQPDDFTLVLELYGWDEDEQSGTKRLITLSAHPKFARVGLLDEAPAAPAWPPDFAAWIKSNLTRGVVRGLRVVNDDRQAALLIETKEGTFELLLSILGTRSNLYALDGNGRIRHSLRALDSTRSDLRPGASWTDPPKPEGASDGEDRWGDVADGEYLQAVAAHYGELEAEQAFTELHRVLERCLDKELDFARRKAGNLQKDLESAKDAREKKHYGELLKSVMHSVKPGDTSVRANDYETGQEIEISLDPKLSPAENLDRYFKRYHKGLVGTNMLGQQLEIVLTHVSEVESLKAALAEAGDLPALEKFARNPVMQGFRKKHFPEHFKPTRPPKKTPQKKDVPGRMRPRRYKTTDGLEIWVGKSDDGNDYLTTQLAAGNDWFFHVQGHPGSHTVLRTGGRKDPPQESVLEAAELCVHFSKLKAARRVTVHIAPIKNVHKPKGAKPGLVYVNQGKSIDLRRDEERMKRILAARIKDEQ